MGTRRTKKVRVVEEVIDDGQPPRRRRRLLHRVIILGLLLLGFVGLAPYLVANSPLRDMLLNWQMPVGGWRVQCGSAGLNWTGPQSMSKVAILDVSAQPLMTIESLEWDRSLLGLVFDSANLGTLRIIKPTLYVATRADGSNVEDFLAALKRRHIGVEPGSIEAAHSPNVIDLQIVDATVKGIDKAAGQEWHVQGLNLSAARDSTGSFSADGSATIANKSGAPSGRIKLVVAHVENDDEQFEPKSERKSRLDLTAERVPLETLGPWAKRVVGDSHLAGTAAVEAHVVWGAAPAGRLHLHTWGKAETANLAFFHPMLHGDELRADRMVVPWKLDTDGDRVRIEELKIEGDWLQMSALGALKLPDSDAVGRPDSRLSEFSCEGKVAIAKVAAMLPNALQIRDGVTLHTGDLTFSTVAQKDADDYKWSAKAEVAGINGERNGKKVTWDQPISVSAAWEDSPNGPRLDRFHLEAPFASGTFTTKADRLEGEIQCDLNRLSAELSQFADLGLNCQGRAQGKLSLSSKDKDFHIPAMAGTIDGLVIDAGDIAVKEPHVEFSGDCRWNSTDRRLASSAFELASSMLAFRSRGVQLEFPFDKAPVMTGDLAVRADLERLSRAAGLESTWARGMASSVVRLATNAEQMFVDFTLDGENLQLVKKSAGGPPAVVWSEPKLNSAGKAVYVIATEHASIDNLRIDGQSMRFGGSASWYKPRAGGPATLSGQLHYDPATLRGLIASYTGPAVHIQGDGNVRFEIRGRLAGSNNLHWSRLWHASAEAGWHQAAVFGLPISQSRLAATLTEGRLSTQPLNLSVGAGRLTSQPAAVLDPEPQYVVIPAGPLITNVQISPAVSEQMLKYVAPVLAGATRVDGQFSLQLAETRVPISDPRQIRSAGNLSVHQLSVLPGPLLVDVVSLVQRIQSLKNPQDLLTNVVAPQPTKLLSMSDQQIEFKVENGRVYHRELEFVVDNVPITSTGSVGLDQTLALEIQIPIQERWIDGEPALSGLRGQTLRIPIQGTFQSPSVDQRAIADITRQLIRNTAGQAIGNEINRQLEKLFQGK